MEISQIPIQINNFLKIKNTNTPVFNFYEMTGTLNAGYLMTRADLILLCFADTAWFYKLKICDNLALSKSIGCIVPTAFGHALAVCHILVVFPICPNFL